MTAPTTTKPAGSNPAGDLVPELRRAGIADVDDSGLARALYSSDGSLYRVLPRAVVRPRHVDEMVATLAVPMIAHGGGLHGVLSVYAAAARPWTEDEVQALVALAAVASSALSSGPADGGPSSSSRVPAPVTTSRPTTLSDVRP